MQVDLPISPIALFDLGSLDLLSEQGQLAMLAAGVDSRVTNVFRAEDIPDTRRPGYDRLKEDLP